MPLPGPGDQFQDKYRIVSVLGEGGMGRVYRAVDVEVDREVAIKLILPQRHGFSDTDIARLHREARVLGNLTDPHTITLYDFGRTSDDLFYLVFEYIEGHDLDMLLERQGALGEARTRRILTQILESLREAHAAGILHRDLKPANILVYDYLDDRDCVKVIDFGIAKPFGAEAIVDGTLTAEGSVIGTVLYMSPEQLRAQKLTPATDVFSAGLLAYEMLTGRRAIPEEERFDIWGGFARGRSISLPADVPVSPPMRTLVDLMLRTPLPERYQSADEVLRALRASSGQPSVTATQSHSAPPPALPTIRETLDRPAEPSGGWVPLIVALALGFSAIGAVALFFSDDEPIEEPHSPPVVQRHEPPAPQDPSPTTAAPVVLAEPDLGRTTADAPDASDVDAAVFDPCEAGPRFSGIKQFTRSIGGEVRIWLTYQPRAHVIGTRQPVVMMVHGFGRTAEQMLQYTEILELAEEKGFVVIAPSSATSFPIWRKATDYPFLRGTVESSTQDLCIDPSRIFALGHGRGGFVVERLACQMPLAGMATTGHRGEESCTPAPPVPYIRLEGIENRTEPVEGGHGCTGRPVVALQAREIEWFGRYECTGPLQDYPTPRNAECVTRNCAAAPFVSCKVKGGRDWKGAPPQAGVGLTPDCAGKPADFPYRDVIWEFFETHGTPTRPDDW